VVDLSGYELQGLDAVSAAFLRQDHPIVGVWVFGPRDSGSSPSYEEFLALVASRLHLTPMMRTIVRTVPLPLARPVWVEDPDFDLRRHVLEYPAPDPCGHAELARLARELMGQPLDYAHPLWRFHFLTPPDGSAVVITTAQHAHVDGAGAFLAVANLTLSGEPTDTIEAPQPWEPGRYSDPDLVAHTLRQGRQAAVRRLRPADRPSRPRRALDATARVGELAKLIQDLQPSKRISARPGDRAPAREELGFWSTPQTEVKLLSRQLGVTINVIMLAALSGAVRGWALEVGREPQDFPVLLPIALARAGDERNALAMTLVRLGCDIADPLRRLRVLDERHRQALKGERVDAVLDLIKAVALAPPGLRRSSREWLKSVGDYDFTVSNVPGPPIPMFLLGCLLTHVYATGALRGPDCAKVTVASCSDNITASLLTDVDQIASADRLLRGLDESLQELIDLGSRLSLLRSQRVLVALRDSAHDQLATSMRPLSVGAGQSIVDEHEHEDDPSFFLLGKGRCEILVDGARTRELQAPSSFGEIAALRREPRTAAVRALTDCDLYAIDGSTFRDAVNKDFVARRMAAEVVTLRRRGEEPAPLSR
jgi:diacylglycerol O-acyltransferase